MHDLPTEPPLLTGKLKEPIGCLIITNIVFLSLIDILLVFIIPVFRAMFADFGAKLPNLTKWAIYWSTYRHDHWFFSPLGGIVIGGFLFLEIAEGRSAARRWLKYSAIVTATLFVVLLLAMFAPVFALGAVSRF